MAIKIGMLRDNTLPTIQTSSAWAVDALAGSPSPALDARLLLQHLLGVNHAYLIAHSDQLLSSAQWETYQAFVARARQGEPVPYIVGHADFYGRTFAVTPAVLIPRPETEELTAHAIEWARARPGCRIADVGTGSGCIAVTLACELPAAQITAVDISEDALAIAEINAVRHDVAERLRFLLGDLLAPLATPADLIVANLPYISDVEWTTLDDGVKSYEPVGALRGGPDGLAYIRQLLLQAIAGQLGIRGAIMLEIGWRQGQVVLRLAKEIFPQAEVLLLKDLSGQDRIVKIQT
jgi:release factor glutamine methyltransferase